MMFGKVTLALVTMAVSSTQGAFVTTAPSVAHSSGTTLGLHGMVAPSASLNHRRTNNKNAFQRNMSTTDDEVAKLLAAAKKAREEADDLSRVRSRSPNIKIIHSSLFSHFFSCLSRSLVFIFFALDI
jgi:hypothetical protein